MRTDGIFTRFLTFFLPKTCPVCGGKPVDGEPNMFCGECLKAFHFVRKPECPGCGGELSGILDVCPDCLHAPEKRPWEKAVALFVMEGPVKETIYRFKYRNEPELARPLGRLGADILRESSITPEVITWTPLHWSRCLHRGYNQAELLARELSSNSGIPAERLLKRRRITKQQANLGRMERIRNMKDAFAVLDPEKVRGRRILLVDDVLTTGATLTSETKELLLAGAAEVCVFVLARRQTDMR